MTFFESFVEFAAVSPLVFVYALCAVFGGTLILLQLFLMMFGFGGGEDASDFGDSTDGASPTDVFRIVSFRTLTAGIAFFGLGGLAGLIGEFSPAVSLIIAIISGSIALYAVYYLYWAVGRMKVDGSLSEKTLVGTTGSVYFRIPSAKSGIGKVQVTQQGRTVEYEAITAGEELKSGTPVVVVAVVSTTTIEVTAAMAAT